MSTDDIKKLAYAAWAGRLSLNMRGWQREIEQYLQQRGWHLHEGLSNARDQQNRWRDHPDITNNVQQWERAFAIQRDLDFDAAKPLIDAALAEPQLAVLPN